MERPALAAYLLAVASAFAPGTSRPSAMLPRAVVRQCTADEPVQLWHVLFNGSSNMREYAERVLIMVADLSAEEANGVVTATSRCGSAVVGTWERVVAEHVAEGMTQAGLRASLRPAEAEVDGAAGLRASPRPAEAEINGAEMLYDGSEQCRQAFIRAYVRNSGCDTESTAQEARRRWRLREKQQSRQAQQYGHDPTRKINATALALMFLGKNNWTPPS